MNRILATLAITLLLAGCGTTYKAVVTLTTAEDSVMKSWATLHNDHVTTPQIDAKVVQAHQKFADACEVAKKALIAYKANGDQGPYLLALAEAKALALPILDLITPFLDSAKVSSLKSTVTTAVTP